MQRVFAGFLLLACAAGAAAVPYDTDRLFAQPHRLVDVGGRRLNLYCSGAGPVTVVFESPSNDPGWSWHAVQPRVAARTRACVYDRAGFGFSDPSPLAPTLGNDVADLHALLRKAGIAPPYVLVGNSLGGGIVQLYAYRHPDEVKALVLVEPQNEDETARMDKASQGKMKQMYVSMTQVQAQCAAAAEKGLVPGTEQFRFCTGGMVDAYGRELAAAQLASVMQPRYWRTAGATDAAMEAGKDELRAARHSFGDLPLVVLTRGVSPYAIPGKPQSALNKATEDENRRMNEEVAALSTRSRHHVVPGAGHIIQEDKPDAVVAAVSEALAMAGY